MDTIEKIVSNAQTATGGVFVISFLIILSYINVIKRMDHTSPFKDHIILITGASIIVPSVLFLGVTDTISKEAVTGLLGTIVGYFFQKRA